MKRTILSLILLAIIFGANGQLPGTLSYQGILVTSLGAPVADGSHSVTFHFYKVPSGGVEIFG